MRRGLSAPTRAARNPGTALLDCRTCYKHQLPADAHVRCLDLLSVAQSNFWRVCLCGDGHCARLRQRCRRTSPGRRCNLVDHTHPEAAPGLEYFRPANQHSPHLPSKVKGTQRMTVHRASFSTMMRGPCLWPNGSPTSTLQRPAASLPSTLASRRRNTLVAMRMRIR
jgi:hypothetical protein